MTKHWNRAIGTLALLAALTLGQSAVAQEAVEPEALAEVAQAFEQTLAVTGLHLISQSLTESAGGNEGFTLNTQQTQEFDLVRNDDDWNATGSFTTSITLPIGAFELGAEIIRVDGVTYVRFNKVPAGIPLDLPKDWVNLDEFTAEQETDNGLALTGNLLLGTSGEQLLAALMIPLNSEAVTQLTLLPSDEIEGQAMRVYQINADPALVLESDAAGLLNASAADGFGGFPRGRANGFPPQGTPELPDPAEMTTPAPEDIQITFAVYIGEADGLVHRIYSIVAVVGRGEGDNSISAITVTSITDYSKFNEPAEIIAPEISS